MRLKNIKPTIDVINKLNLPSSPIIRTRIFRILVELEQEQQIITKLETSYKNQEFIDNEKQKYEFVKTFQTESGVRIFDLYVSQDNVLEIISGLAKYNNNDSYKQYQAFLEHLESEYFVKTELLNIDDLSDDTFNSLTSDEIELLMEIIN